MLKQYECPICQGILEAERDLVPKQLSCPHCGEYFTLGASKLGPGLTIAGYRIEEKLGSGGMGDVWLATQLSMDRKVALKILPSTMTQRSEAVLAFTGEARLLAKLDHPNIVTAFDFGEYAGLYYLAMTYVEGEDLAVRLHKQGTISEPEALGVALKVAQALAYAWSQFKLLHRDVNPANIMIDRYGDVRLMDLGIGKTMQEGVDPDSETHLVGTPNYMSPEQAEGRSDLDCRADMYALGATLYHLVTGQVPYDDPDPHTVLARMRTETLPPAQSVNRNVSPECTALISRLMQRNRDNRFASWDEVINTLKQFKVQMHVSTAGSPSRPGVAAALCGLPESLRRKPLFLVLGALLLVGLVSLAVISVMFDTTTSPLEKLPPPITKKEVPEVLAPGVRSENTEILRQAQVQKIKHQINASGAYLKGAEPDYDQALAVLNKLRSEAQKARVEHLVNREVDRIQKMKNKAEQKRKPEVVVNNSARALNGQEQARLQALRNACGHDVTNRDFEGALGRIRNAEEYAWPEAGTKKLTHLQKVIRELASAQEQVYRSFAGEVGREIIVPLKSGKEKLRIVEARQNPVVAEIVLRKDGKPAGSIRCALDVNELEPAEQIRRAGHAGSPVAPLLRVLVALKHKDYRQAQRELAGYEGLFAEQFKAELLTLSN